MIMRARAIMLPAGPAIGRVAVAPRRDRPRRGDVDGWPLDAERVDHQLGVFQALRARRPVGHANADHVVGAERLGGEVGHQRAVHAAGEADDDLLETAAALHLVADELDQPATGELGIDRERILVARTGGAAGWR